jgi:hypothetical protein
MAIQTAKPHPTLLRRRRTANRAAKPRPTPATWCPRRSTPCTVYWGGAAQAKVALNGHSTKAEGGNQKVPANQEQTDCCSTTGARTDLQRGEVLLMKRMGTLSQVTPTSSASKRAYDAIFTGNLMSSQVAALDELFPATNNRAGRRATRIRHALLEWRSRSAQLSYVTFM